MTVADGRCTSSVCFTGSGSKGGKHHESMVVILRNDTRLVLFKMHCSLSEGANTQDHRGHIHPSSSEFHDSVLVDEIPMYWTKYNMDESKQQDGDIVMTSGGLVGSRIVSTVEGRDKMGCRPPTTPSNNTTWTAEEQVKVGMGHLVNNIYLRQYWDYDYIIYVQNSGRVSGRYRANEQHMNMT